MNPHTRIWVEAKNGEGAVASWDLEFPPPNAPKRMLENRDFVEGGQVSVTLWRAKDGAMPGCALSMVFPDGRVMNLPSGWTAWDAGARGFSRVFAAEERTRLKPRVPFCCPAISWTQHQLNLATEKTDGHE